jgi:K+-transporting ATPase KdpF subunit
MSMVAGNCGAATTMLENVLLLVLTAGLLVYLVFALLRPEKF